ncbi:MAG: hypothetical protein WCP60_10345 [bacterium]
MIRTELSMETNYLSDGFAKIDHDLRELMTCLTEVLEELAVLIGISHLYYSLHSHECHTA